MKQQEIKQAVEKIKEKIYDILYKKSRVDVISFINEDEWPIDELSSLIDEEKNKAFNMGFDDGVKAVKALVTNHSQEK